MTRQGFISTLQGVAGLGVLLLPALLLLTIWADDSAFWGRALATDVVLLLVSGALAEIVDDSRF